MWKVSVGIYIRVCTHLFSNLANVIFQRIIIKQIDFNRFEIIARVRKITLVIAYLAAVEKYFNMHVFRGRTDHVIVAYSNLDGILMTDNTFFAD